MFEPVSGYHDRVALIVGQRPDLQAYDTSVRASLPDVVQRLRDLLTPRLVAFIAGVGETRAVHEWASGARAPRAGVEEKLRFALQVALMVGEPDGPRVAQAWFQGLNPQLDDRSPARLVRDGDVAEIGPLVLAAARAFVVGG